MDTIEPREIRKAAMSSEAMIGLGITSASLGVLFLLLGWAQYMRKAMDSMPILLGIGAVLFVVGLIVWMMGNGRARRRS